jgi:hypothetical protein
MNDILFVALTVLLFSLSLWLLNALDGLREDKS